MSSGGINLEHTGHFIPETNKQNSKLITVLINPLRTWDGDKDYSKYSIIRNY